jgi:hypothetical protein
VLCLRRGFIRGPKDGKKPDIVAFANRFPRGALLTTCWRNGKISFCPRTPPPSFLFSLTFVMVAGVAHKVPTLAVCSLFPTPKQRGAAQVVRECEAAVGHAVFVPCTRTNWSAWTNFRQACVVGGIP